MADGAPRLRFPGVEPGAGHYESLYLKACHPDGGRGLWIRYTVHKRPGEPAKGFTWLTLFDAATGIWAAKAQTAPPAADGSGLQLGDSVFAPGRVTGRALEADWDLRFTGTEPPLEHFPRRWMYRAPLPRTKVLSPYPSVRFSGQVTTGARTVALDGWPGTVGHNWGSEHAHRAIWLHGANFAGHEAAWLDLAIGRVRVGPVITPWVANGALALDGQRYQLGGLGRRSRIDEAHERCRFELTGSGIRVRGEARGAREHFVGWLYAQPSGEERQTINCSIADLTLEVSRPGRPPVELAVSQGAAYELQMAERYPPISVQPYGDG